MQDMKNLEKSVILCNNQYICGSKYMKITASDLKQMNIINKLISV
jgi:hypothetical protein